MKIIRKISELNKIVKDQAGKTSGFVPTMGNLHNGHFSLIERARSENEFVIVSIFVNPTQFNNIEDYNNYPNTLSEDFAKSEDLGADIIFLPNKEEMYPDKYEYKITCSNNLATAMEGEFRPGHFDGVLTVVFKLLQITKATKAYFSVKDYQQLHLVDGMAKAFFLETEIIACDTLRHDSGLPLSSRNTRLSKENLEKAHLFAKLLRGSKTPEQAAKILNKNNIVVEYIEDFENRRFAAVNIDDIRLIDNYALTENT